MDDEKRVQKEQRLNFTVSSSITVEKDCNVQCTSKFYPLHVVSEWRKPGSNNKRLKAAIVLPSGIDGNFTVRVFVDGGSIILSVTWTSPIVDLL